MEEENDLELDEVEIQKGLSQLAKGLQFLHESAKLVHGNLTPEAVVINAKVSSCSLLLPSTPRFSVSPPTLSSSPSLAVINRANPLLSHRRATGSSPPLASRPTSSTPSPACPPNGTSWSTTTACRRPYKGIWTMSVRLALLLFPLSLSALGGS